MAPLPDKARSRLGLAVLVAALGYFVDIYDLVLFSILRVPSLKGIGVAEADLTNVGAILLDVQLFGMMVGGVVLGMIGDKRGRLSVLFASIVVYSLANFANAFVGSVWSYGLVRFIAGFGLAGELGAGITLVSELTPTRLRGVMTTIVASVGLTGALVAGSLAGFLQKRYGEDGWRAAYIVGGAMGLVLLALRFGVLESDLFKRSREEVGTRRGDLGLLFATRERALRFLRVVAVGVPIWFVGGVIFVFSPEIGGALGLTEKPTGANTIFYAYTGVVIGDVVSGFLSQQLKKRKVVMAAFIAMLAAGSVGVLVLGGSSLSTYYWTIGFVGFASGYWVLFATAAAEQFGTNLRATVATSAPNFVRGAAIPISLTWLALKGSLGVVGSTLAVGAVTFAFAGWALISFAETFDSDLDRVET